MDSGDVAVIDRDGLTAIIRHLRDRGYRTLGPVMRDGAIVLGEVAGADDLPAGWHDVQAPGSYRLWHGADEALFAWAVGPQSVKAEVFPPHAVLWRTRTADETLSIEGEVDESPPVAVIGARPCELAALAVLDRVLGSAPTADPTYRRRRAASFVVAVECGSPAATCFCTSMGTGPGAEGGGFDLALTELLDEAGHRFLVRVGTVRGAEVLAAATSAPARDADRAARAAVLRSAADRVGRRLETDGLPALLARNLEHPRWDDVADRCLACGNCTLVCPTCFCSTIEDVSDLGGTASRQRSWASCFDLAHSHLHGGPVRQSLRSRYRQWMTHKLSTWWDQFGTSGCVGCGRCIAWCPAGIDITAEAAAIRKTDGAPGAPGTPAASGDGHEGAGLNASPSATTPEGGGH